MNQPAFIDNFTKIHFIHSYNRVIYIFVFSYNNLLSRGMSIKCLINILIQAWVNTYYVCIVIDIILVILVIKV